MTGIWTMKGGETILIKDMSDDHLINTVNMLKRNSENTRNLKAFEYDKYAPLSDGAEDAMLSERASVLCSDWEDYAPPVIIDLRCELEKRGIKLPETWNQSVKEMVNKRTCIFVVDEHLQEIEDENKIYDWYCECQSDI